MPPTLVNPTFVQKFVRCLIIKFESHLTFINHLEISLSLTSKLVTKHGTYVHLNLIDYLELNIKASWLILRLIPMRLYVTILLNIQDKALLCGTWSNVEEPTHDRCKCAGAADSSLASLFGAETHPFFEAQECRTYYKSTSLQRPLVITVAFTKIFNSIVN